MRKTQRQKHAIGVAAHPGKDFDSKKIPFGQDRHSVHHKGTYTVVSVFDGHGSDGHKVSERVNSLLPSLILEQLVPELSGSAIEQILKKSFATCSKAIKDKYSGTTATVAVITPTEIVLANLGDSPALLFTKEGKLLHTTHDHTHDNLEERKRASWDYYDDDISWRIGTGLMVSRAFGDRIEETAGLLHVPEIYRWSQPTNAYLAVCSDSFTEEYRRIKGVQLIMAPNGAKEIVEEIYSVLDREKLNVSRAAKRAVEERVKKFYDAKNGWYNGDNTTLVLLDLCKKSRKDRKSRKDNKDNKDKKDKKGNKGNKTRKQKHYRV